MIMLELPKKQDELILNNFSKDLVYEVINGELAFYELLGFYDEEMIQEYFHYVLAETVPHFIFNEEDNPDEFHYKSTIGTQMKKELLNNQKFLFIMKQLKRKPIDFLGSGADAMVFHVGENDCIRIGNGLTYYEEFKKIKNPLICRPKIMDQLLFSKDYSLHFGLRKYYENGNFTKKDAIDVFLKLLESNYVWLDPNPDNLLMNNGPFIADYDYIITYEYLKYIIDHKLQIISGSDYDEYLEEILKENYLPKEMIYYLKRKRF